MIRAGSYVKNLSKDSTYYSFKPRPLPPLGGIIMGDEMINLLIQAHIELSLLSDRSSLIPNNDLFLSMFVRKEALLTSQIEGTQATLQDILDPEIDSNTNLEVNDVIKTIEAINYGVERLDSLPLSNRLIKEIHKKLLSSIRGQDKNPGEFRRSQNWIGGSNSNIKSAHFIPPNVEDMNQALNDLESYIHQDEKIDHLIKIALIHYQFETIHPFLDGNGRIGRILVLIYLLEKNVLKTPVLYISTYLKLNRQEYYDRLTLVREDDNFEQWIMFFLRALIFSAQSGSSLILELHNLNNKNIKGIENHKVREDRKNNLLAALKFLNEHPITDINSLSKHLQLSFTSTKYIVDDLVQLNILLPTTTQKRNKVFAYKEYLELLNKDID